MKKQKIKTKNDISKVPFSYNKGRKIVKPIAKSAIAKRKALESKMEELRKKAEAWTNWLQKAEQIGKIERSLTEYFEDNPRVLPLVKNFILDLKKDLLKFMP